MVPSRRSRVVYIQEKFRIDLDYADESQLEGHTDFAVRRIGQGFCGTVWATLNGTVAMKREDGGPGRSLQNDFIMHKNSLEALRACQSTVTVPHCH